MSLVLPRGDATVYRPSVCPSVTFRYPDHIGWNTSKIISPPNSDKIVMWRFLCNCLLIFRLHIIFRTLIHWAHRAVIFAIAWFSCWTVMAADYQDHLINLVQIYHLLTLLYMYTVSQKMCQLIFCSFSVKYEPISIKIGWSVPECPGKLLTKLCPNCPLNLKYVLALPWETWTARLSRHRDNEVHISMTNWIATNITGNNKAAVVYCLSKSHVSHHIYWIRQ